MYTPQRRKEAVIVYDKDGVYVLAEYLGKKGQYGEHFKCQRLIGPQTTAMYHYEDIHELTEENQERLL